MGCICGILLVSRVGLNIFHARIKNVIGFCIIIIIYYNKKYHNILQYK